MIKVKYKIKEVKPSILLVEFEDKYDMCMTFWRCQETYESPNPKFRNKNFTLVEFMRWYAKKFGKGSFTYTNDWSGFNFPSSIITLIVNGGYDEATNEYDRVMEDIYYECLGKLNDIQDKFYLIGALKGNEKTIKHEIAHGLFYLNKTYKKQMTALVKNLKPSLKKKLFLSLEKIGYTKYVFIDEAQAYMSTGMPEKFGITLNGQDKNFIKVYNSFYE